MDPKLITPILLAALVAWAIWRRLRRTFGRQPVNPGRIWLRIAVFALVGGLVLVTGVARNPQMLGAVIAGIACGATLAYVGLRYTLFEVTPEGRFYTPHTYIGVAVTVLFLSRLLYRLLYLSPGIHSMGGANRQLVTPYQASPLTFGIIGALVGYYLLFYGGVLVKTRAPEPSTGTNSSE